MEVQQEEQQDLEAQKTSIKNKKVDWFIFLLGVFVGCLIVATISIVFICGNSSSFRFKKKSQMDKIVTPEVVQKMEKLEEGISAYYLRADELDSMSADTIADYMYHGLVEGLGDPYSTYFNEEELNSMLESTKGVYYGIGAYIGYNEEKDYCMVSKCMDNSPAMEAGLKANDIIVAVDGKDMYKVTTSEIVTYIKGPEHTNVELTIYREGESDYLKFNVERSKIETPTVSYKMLDDKIAYIQISEFDGVTGGQFEQHLNQANDDGMKALIVDLRDNPGGSLTTVVDMASMVVSKKLIVYTEDRYKNRTEYKGKYNSMVDVPMVVLVNGNSASASEIFSGAIQDYDKGIILGTQTFGKGIVQKIFSLDDGTALKLTICHYYTPNGNDIHGIGITPDEVIELDVDKYLEDKTDNQLNRAVEILKKKIK